MIWSRLSLLRPLFQTRREARDVGRRWSQAARANSDLQLDLIRFGGLLSGQAVELRDGIPELAPIDPLRLAYEAGRRDLATQLLALMGLSYPEMNRLMENEDE
ncbi:MAG: hypothetical protein DI533_04665 [Cereibacter sphaeroides]|uniref:Uncharacterized protein n=1 Tax=Cereibacter sphaeroides TaxID=1063 RepID=A0A2W5TV39_CERSP|nr:MAG: hypothetical protein DI533_04665 [Cereibacter sphaeroides]